MTEHHSFKKHGAPDGEPVLGKTFRADGWALMMPNGFFTQTAWDEVVETVGPENIHVLGKTEGTGDGQHLIGVTMLISPMGMDRLTAANVVLH